MAGEIINVEGLSALAVKYNPVLRELPALVLDERLGALKINRLDVKGTLKERLFRRKGGLSLPYSKQAIGEDPDYISEIGKIEETELKPEDCVLPFYAHIKDLAAKVTSGNNPTSEVADNISKEHPLKATIIKNVLLTVGEDILQSVFPAVRNTADKTPKGMMDGFDKKIADLLAAAKLRISLGNYCETGAITNQNAFSKLVTFLRGADRNLLRNGILYITPTSMWKVCDSITAELQTSALVKKEDVISYLKSQCSAPNLEIIECDEMGTGDNWILCQPWVLEVGLDTSVAPQFCQVRTPFQDPNYVQFWTQWGAGCRIADYHAKVFRVNDQLPVDASDNLYGDYRS